MNVVARKPEVRTKWLKIGEVSKRSGIGIETLRFYEKQGLLRHATRTQGNYRLYSADALERLEFIKRAQMLGFTLAEIAQIIREKEAGKSPCVHVREIVRRKLAELDERLKEMRRYRNELAAALAEWDETGEEAGEVCGLIEHTEMAATLPEARRLKGGKRQ